MKKLCRLLLLTNKLTTNCEQTILTLHPNKLNDVRMFRKTACS